MKNPLLILMMICLSSLGMVSCDDDDDNSNSSSSQLATQVRNTVQNGTWYVSSFIEDDIDHTVYFASYDFTFGPQNLLTATNGTNTQTGTWSVTSDNSSDDSPSSDVDFNIFFNTQNNFDELNEDWDILERTDNKIRLRHVSGGDGSIDLLTFEKN